MWTRRPDRGASVAVGGNSVAPVSVGAVTGVGAGAGGDVGAVVGPVTGAGVGAGWASAGAAATDNARSETSVGFMGVRKNP